MKADPNNEPPPPSLLRMAAPLVVSFWMRAAVALVDTVYASTIGDAAVAAIGLTVPFEFLMIAFWVGLSTGLTSGLSRAMGAREGRRIEQYLAVVRRLVGLTAPFFFFVGVGVWWLAPHVGLEPDLASSFRIYGSVLIGGSALSTFWSVIPDSLVKAHQDTRSTMWAGIWTNLINVGLNSLFLFVFEWGIFGIALSTVIGRFGGLAYALHRAAAHERRRIGENRTPGTQPDPRPYRTVLSLAVPSSATFALMALEAAAINGLLAGMRNATEAIAAYSIYYRVLLFSLQPVIATSVAMLPYAAFRVGMGDFAGVRTGLRQAMWATAVYSVGLLGPPTLLFAPWLAERLSESALTREYATVALYTVPVACLAGALFLLCRPIFEAMNQGRPGLVMAVLRYVFLTAPLCALGIYAAAAAGTEPLYGLVGGLLVVAAVSSTVFYLWLRSALPAAGRPAAAVPKRERPPRGGRSSN
jgi:Na+-driven multidrug efflux pump